MSTFIKQCSVSTVIAALLMSAVYVSFEPTLSNAATTESDNVTVSLTVDASVSITDAPNVTMTPNIDAAISTSTASSTWNVKTNDPDGYTLTIRNASTSPALKHSTTPSLNFANYTEATPGTPEILGVDSGTYQFAYSARGTDVSTGTYGTGANCGTGTTPTLTLKYRHASTSAILAATRAATTTTSGVDTEVCWVAIQNGVYAPAGSYSALITTTANVI